MVLMKNELENIMRRITEKLSSSASDSLILGLGEES